MELEYLESGPEPEPRPSLWGRRRVRVGVAGVAAAAVVATLAGAGWQLLQRPDVDGWAVRFLDLVEDDQSYGLRSDAVAEGRARFDLEAIVAAEDVGGDGADWRVVPLGLTGPGVESAAEGLAAEDAQQGWNSLGVRVRVRVGVDCADVRLPLAASDYALAVRVEQDGRTAEGRLPLAGAKGDWLDLLNQDCVAAQVGAGARITAVRGRVDPGEPAAALVLTVDNASPLDLAATGAEFGEGLTALTGVAAPAGMTAELPLDVRMRRCPTYLGEVGVGRDDASPPVTVYVAPPAAVRETRDPYELGLAWQAEAARDLVGLLTQACAGIDRLEIDRGAAGPASFDAATGVYEAVLALRFPEGWEGLATVRPTAPASGPFESGSPEPLWDATGPTAPGPEGVLAVPVRYRLPESGGSCGEAGPLLVLDVEVLRQGAAGPRTAWFEVVGEGPPAPDLEPADYCR
jgi:hypothetical protein